MTARGRGRLLLRRNNYSCKILPIGLIGDIFLVIYHRIFDNTRAARLGYREKSVRGVVVEINSGSSAYGVELSVYLKRILHAAAAGIPHNVGVGIDVARARLHRKRRAELIAVADVVVIVIPSVHKGNAGQVLMYH